MTIEQARRFLIASSLSITGLQIVFLFIAPAFGYPLSYPKNIDLLQIISPVFLGYLGSASHFIFQTPSPTINAQNQYLGLLLKGPIAIYIMAVISAFAAFGYSNRVGAAIGSGMSTDNLATALTLCLSLLAVTTGVLSSYLFVTPDKLKLAQQAAQADGGLDSK